MSHENPFQITTVTGVSSGLKFSGSCVIHYQTTRSSFSLVDTTVFLTCPNRIDPVVGNEYGEDGGGIKVSSLLLDGHLTSFDC